MPETAAPLRRVVGLPGAVALGLGSILGTGVFVSLLFITELVGPATPWCIAAAAVLATCNGLSSAQLAAAHPVSGGSYEYGYRYLSPVFGFTAGWMFLAAKSASAATAALGLSAGAALAAGDDSCDSSLSFLLIYSFGAECRAPLQRDGRADARPRVPR